MANEDETKGKAATNVAQPPKGGEGPAKGREDAKAAEAKAAQNEQAQQSSGGGEPPPEAPPQGDRPELSGAALDQARMMRGVTENAADEYARLGVNPRLDNRLGDQRPRMPLVPKPQQFDGPEIGHFEEHAEQFRGDFEEALNAPLGEPRGMKSEGPHGVGPHGVTIGDEHGQPVEPLSGAATEATDPRNPA